MRLLRRPRLAALFAPLLVASGSALAAPGGSVQDFRLPPGPGSTPQQQPAPQGPVAPDVPASRQVLEPAPTPAPTSPTTSVTPAPGASPRIVLPPLAVPEPVARPTSGGASPAAPVAPAPAGSQAAGDDAAVAEAERAGAERAGPAVPAPPAPPVAEPAEERGAAWLWPLAALLAVAGLALGLRAWRRRQVREPVRERAVAAPLPRPLPAPPEPEPDRGPLAIALEPLRLSLTLMNATLAYRLVVTNRGAEPVEALAIAADMIAAHASLGREQQLAGPGEDALRLAVIERLEPGESRSIAGEYRLPLACVRPIRQGPAALLLPLARIRIERAGGAPAIGTFLVALPPGQPGARLQPIRLDLGPRIYSTLAARAFA
ncbi:MAG: hypothetical protein H5U21_07220 [Porphyrobacter sp.]|nr:hypothetical protein [Porphyrobacter sp.]